MKFSNALNLILIFSLALAGMAGTVGNSRAQAASAAGLSSQNATSEAPQLHLQGGSFDPLQGEPANYPAALAGDLQPDTNGLRMVQFAGPIQDEWLESLQQSGLNLVAYLPDYGYLVWGNGEAVTNLEKTAPLRWSGAYRPAYALSPLLATTASDQASIDVLVQVYRHPEADKIVAQIAAAGTILRQPYDVLAYRNLGVRLPADQLGWLANLPGVVEVQPFQQPVKLDEIQDQIMAGSLSGSSPTGPGYLAWLQSKGFSTNPNDYPIVDVTDDGIDIGTTTPAHPDFYQFGSKSNASRVAYMVNYSTDATADGGGGHGNLNAAIVAGYNNQSGSAYKDSNGYNYGLGVSPYGRVAGSKTFSNSGSWTYGGTYTALVSDEYGRGARISSNSWGYRNSGAYSVDDQEYDTLARDAVPGQSGNQAMIFAMAGGNDGSKGSTTITSPGTAKNVITVGASENVRPNLGGSSWTDGCGLSANGANSAMDIAGFSSRGPTSDGRFKPEIMAPGTHIISAASQSANYDGSGVCDKYAPSGQYLYAASSGTSHSTPAIAGALSLLYRYYQVNFGGQPPSPAMARAYLTNGARWMNGNGAFDTLPSANQGMGLIDLGMAFDGVKRQVVDQSVLLASTGQSYTLNGMISDTSKPFRVTLAWTDAPGTPAAASYVNNLNLEVTIGGQTYLGNVFDATQKAVSTAGGTADAKNNLESVFLPAGASGAYTVKVKAANIAGDGLPGNGDATDQDFALVVYNGADASGVLQGQVTSATGGAALSGVKIQAAGAITQTTTTDASGAYSIQLPTGNYNLTVWKYGYVQQTTSASISAGGTVTRDFSLAVAPVYSLTGCVTDAITGQGLKAGLVVSDAFSAQVAETATTLLNNCYSLNLSQGVFTLRASSLLHQDRLATVTMTTARTQNMALTATTTNGRIFGVVSELAGGAAVAGANIAISPGGQSTVSGSDGSYSIQLAPGAYTVDVSAPLYTAAQATNVIVPQSNLVEQNFSLQAPKMSLSPTALITTLDSGGQANLNLAVANLGAVGLDYVAYESDGRPPSGGPDTYGYLLLDSRNSGGVSYNWIDMTSATPASLTDDGEVNLTLPFSFEFYGVSATSLRVGNNGGALFNATTGDVLATNAPLASGPAYLIAPYWTDLDATTGSVSSMTDGTAPNRRFIVAWQGRPHYGSSSSGTVTFQMVLYEGSNNLKFQYQDASFGDVTHDNGVSATVGIRGASGQVLQVSYNTAWLADGLALCFQHPRSQPCDPQDIAWMSATPMNGLLVTSAPQNTLVTVDTALTPGKGGAFAVFRFLSNDPSAQPYRDVPVVVLMNPLWMPLVIRR